MALGCCALMITGIESLFCVGGFNLRPAVFLQHSIMLSPCSDSEARGRNVKMKNSVVTAESFIMFFLFSALTVFPQLRSSLTAKV